MFSVKALSAVEYFKITKRVSSFAVLDESKKIIEEQTPCDSYFGVEILLKKTKEAYRLLYELSWSDFPFFENCKEQLFHCQKGGVLNVSDLFKIKNFLIVSRTFSDKFKGLNDVEIKLLKEVADRIVVFDDLERDLVRKIADYDKIADDATFDLANARRLIRQLNSKIREKINSYAHGELGKYLQDNVVTLRAGRYVVPVKSEYRSFVKGLVHDQSSSGATVFIEPEQIIDLNNKLKEAMLDEEKEIRRILENLSRAVGEIADKLLWNYENLVEIDVCFAKAHYAYDVKGVFPILNDSGEIDIIAGRHPLINPKTVVPIDVRFGESYRFLLVTGPNTGGKTVTLKLTGLFVAMAMSGLFIPALSGSKISVFDNLFCDVGDEQSIEQSLSTFSSHMTNVIDFLNTVNEKSLVLLDELGAGTDPDEGSALALAIIEKLLEKKCCGIITTHYSALKEFAFTSPLIENASVDFDVENYAPLYRLNIGLAGSSNAILIAERLGMDKSLCERAKEHIGERKVVFDQVLRQADAVRRKAETTLQEYKDLTETAKFELADIRQKKSKIEEEYAKIQNNAKLEVNKIVSQKLSFAEDIVEQMVELFDKEEISTGDLIKARTLKNKLKNAKFLLDYEKEVDISNKPINLSTIKSGDVVFVENLGKCGVFVKFVNGIKQAEIQLDNISLTVKTDKLFLPDITEQTKQKQKVTVSKKVTVNEKSFSEINIIGKNVDEATVILDDFFNGAIINKTEEVKIIHGVGTGKLREGVIKYLKLHKFVAEYRQGGYGEGERGVTIVKLKV